MPRTARFPAVILMLLVAGMLTAAAATNLFVRGGVPYAVDKWENDDGLPQNSVVAITQTRDGYLWLGTLNGLVRFDGIRFATFNEANTPGLPSNRIVHLFEDRQGRLWIGTETGGVAWAEGAKVTSLDVGRGHRGGRLAGAAEDPQGAVWLYTADGQLCRYQDGALESWRLGADQFSNYRTLIVQNGGPVWAGMDPRMIAIGAPAGPDRRALPVIEDVPVGKLDRLLASERGGYWRLANRRIEKRTTNRVELDLGAYPWGSTPVSAACEDQEGNLIVGTLGAGVFWFDAQGGFTRLSRENGLSNDYVLSLLVDREGDLWVGTDGGGLNRVKPQAFEVLDETRGKPVRSVSVDAHGGLWVAFNAIGFDAVGAGYWREGTFTGYGAGQGLLNSSVWSVFVDRRDRVWAGTYGGLFQFNRGQFARAAGAEAINPVVLAIHQDRNGRLWVGTQGGLARWDERDWRVFTVRDGLSTNVVTAIADDTEGNVWVGTAGGGLNRLREGRFSIFRRGDGLPNENVSSLLVDAEGVLWVGTDGGGLARFAAGRWTLYSTADGLVSDNVAYLLEDGRGDLWIGSTAGLMRVPKQALNDFAAGPARFLPVRAYGRAVGMPTRECTLGSQPGAARSASGKLWFPTIKGLVSVDPARLRDNPNPPPVFIESVTLDGQPLIADTVRSLRPDVLRIPAGHERLDIQFTSSNLAARDRARFKYRLEGHETAWHDAGKDPLASYTKLLPNRYRFQVTACNEDGVWNPTGATLALIVEPPFWRTWWFLTLIVLGTLGSTAGVVHYVSTQKLQRQLEKLRQQEALEKERARIARDIHDQLGASLTQVSLLGELVESDKDSPAEVTAHARTISQTARDTTRALDEIVWTVNPSNDTLEGLVNYICKYTQDYLAVAGIRYRLEAPAVLPPAAISPEVRHHVFLVAKESITNIVRHAQATTVWLRLTLAPAAFTLEIVDDGRGPAGKDEARARSRNGLRNMSKRMEEIGGRFSLEPAPERGSVARITTPVHLA